MRTLTDMLTDMQDLANNGDTEEAHVLADDLLKEAVLYLARRLYLARTMHQLEEVDALLAAYSSLPKWYA